MAVHTLQAAIPEIELVAGMRVVLEAVSPTTGAAITGVTADDWAIYGIDLSGVLGDLIEDVIPPLTPEEVVLD